MQLKAGRHFVNESPHPSEIFRVRPWPLIMQHPRVICIIIINHCMTGLIGLDGLPLKKPIGISVSDDILAGPLRGLRCDGRHPHDQCFGGRDVT